MKELYRFALHLLARRAHSRRELEQKLSRRGESSVVSEVLDELQKNGWINDQAFALERARSCRTHRNWGPSRIRQDLKKLGVEVETIRVVLSQLAGEEPEDESLARAIDSRLRRFGAPRTSRDLKRLFQSLLRLGYSPGMVRARLKDHFSEIDWSF